AIEFLAPVILDTSRGWPDAFELGGSFAIVRTAGERDAEAVAALLGDKVPVLQRRRLTGLALGAADGEPLPALPIAVGDFTGTGRLDVVTCVDRDVWHLVPGQPPQRDTAQSWS